MFRLFKLSIMTVATLMMLYTLSGAESIFEVQYTSAPGSGNDCYPSPKNGATVTLEGVVTGIMQGSYPYFFIQHPDSTTWNGVYIYDADVNPQLGDSVRVTGPVSEYYGLTELSNLTSFQIIASNRALPDTLLIYTSYLDSCSFSGEKYEGVLVRVEGATILPTDPGFGQHWILDSSGDSCKIDDELYKFGDDEPLFEVGMTYDIVGIVMFNYSEYKINPRFAADAVLSQGAAPMVRYSYPLDRTHLLIVFNMDLDQNSAEDGGNYSISDGVTITSAVLDTDDHTIVTLTTGNQTDGFQYTLTVADIESEGGIPMTQPDISTFRGGFTPLALIQQPISSENDTSRLAGEYVTVKAVATSDTVDFISSYYFVQDNSFSYYNGVKIYNSDYSDPHRGDTLIITGKVQEYFNETEIADLFQYEVAGSGAQITPTSVSPSDITQNSPRAEWYEGVLISVDEPLTVIVLPDLNGNWKVRSAENDTINVYHYGSEYTPELGDVILLTGVVTYNYSEYKVGPREGDITTTGIGYDPDQIPNEFTVAQNYPNPFNAVTSIFYGIPTKSEVNLSIYNLLGEKVGSFPQGIMKPGGHIIRLDYSNFSSGIYFYKLTAGEYSQVKKMALLK
ncbi:MAG: hypothetical protein CO189_03430 [candidate division Zixibacteria bacterium CG_4_9_14_3_um_filter_46_8]|nr:MAG: hypothetical protein CO189_03430 [candidate division Zixibacteria bacterium CG_4_9_14_3_um_filter_46_8]